MPTPCRACQSDDPLAIPFTMAFQPIVDVSATRVWGHEALVRGPEGQGALSVLGQVTADTMYKFDQACRVRAIELAGRLLPPGENAILSINFMPNAVYEPSACIRASIEAARRASFPQNRIMFEFTEDERVSDPNHLGRIVAEYRKHGLLTALDDFGAGYAGLTLLAKLRTDLIKIDMELVRGIDHDRPRQTILQAILGMARDLGVTVLAEGVETRAEMEALRGMGVTLMQGFYFARPCLEGLAEIAADTLPAEPPGPSGVASVKTIDRASISSLLHRYL